MFVDSEFAIARVMDTTGMDRLQAWYHLRAREECRRRLEREHRERVQRCIDRWARQAPDGTLE